MNKTTKSPPSALLIAASGLAMAGEVSPAPAFTGSGLTRAQVQAQAQAARAEGRGYQGEASRSPVEGVRSLRSRDEVRAEVSTSLQARGGLASLYTGG